MLITLLGLQDLTCMEEGIPNPQRCILWYFFFFRVPSTAMQTHITKVRAVVLVLHSSGRCSPVAVASNHQRLSFKAHQGKSQGGMFMLEMWSYEAGPRKRFGNFPKTRGTLLGVPIIRIIVCWGLYWGPPILGKYHL